MTIVTLLVALILPMQDTAAPVVEDPDQIPARIESLLKEDQVEQALEAAGRAVDRWPAHAPAQAAMGDALYRRGDFVEAEQHYRRAVELESSIQYDEPPAWHYPVRQSLGAALLRAGKPAEAEKIFREAIARKPRDGRLLFGLWQSLLVQKRDSEAALVERQFRSAWRNASESLQVEDL